MSLLFRHWRQLLLKREMHHPDDARDQSGDCSTEKTSADTGTSPEFGGGEIGATNVRSWQSSENFSTMFPGNLGSGKWLEREDNFITSASEKMFGVSTAQLDRSPVFSSSREKEDDLFGTDLDWLETDDSSMRDDKTPTFGGSGVPSSFPVDISSSISSPSSSSSLPACSTPISSSSSSYYPLLSSTSSQSNPTPPAISLLTNRKRKASSLRLQFSRFLRSDIAVKAVFDAARGNEPELPLYFFTVVHSFGNITTALHALLPENPSLLDGEESKPLLSFFSCLQQSIGHSYLHSVVGTFSRLCQESFFPGNLAGSIKRKRDLLASPEGRQALEQGFEYLIKMIAVSIPEIPKEIKDAYVQLFKSSQDSKQQRNFVLRSFLSSFIYSALASPDTILNIQLSPGMKVFCSLLALLLKIATTAPPSSTLTLEKDAQFLNSLAKSSYVQRKIDFICSHLLLEKGEEDLMECYIDFLKIWEVYHHPCQRKGRKRFTCLFWEPTLGESLAEMGKVIQRYSPKISDTICQKAKMGALSLDLEAFTDLLEGFNQGGGGF